MRISGHEAMDGALFVPLSQYREIRPSLDSQPDTGHATSPGTRVVPEQTRCQPLWYWVGHGRTLGRLRKQQANVLASDIEMLLGSDHLIFMGGGQEDYIGPGFFFRLKLNPVYFFLSAVSSWIFFSHEMRFMLSK